MRKHHLKGKYNRLTYKILKEEDYVEYVLSPSYGEGSIKSYLVNDCVEVTYNEFTLNKQYTENVNLNENTIEINYCLSGRMEVEFKNGKTIYMTNEDIAFFGYNSEVVYSDFFSIPFKGITVMLYLDKLNPWLKKVIDITGEPIDKFFNDILNADTSIVTHANSSLDHIFKEFYAFPNKYKLKLMELKIIEMLLYMVGGFDYKASAKKYFSKNRLDKIKKVHEIILNDIDKNFTIEELAKRVNLNATYLKSGFKDIYGSPIHSYLKKYRLNKSANLLINTELKVSDIGFMCGYENPSKFAAAFKKIYEVTPLKYRSMKTDY